MKNRELLGKTFDIIVVTLIYWNENVFMIVKKHIRIFIYPHPDGI